MLKSNFLCFSLLIFIVHIFPTIPLETASCTENGQCGSNGICSTLTGTCNCTQLGYVTVKANEPCAHEQKKKLTVFLLSFLGGFTGADWFYLSNGNGGYIAAGIIKLLTFGGGGIWHLIDWIRVLIDSFPDGQGAPLLDWN